MVTWGSSILKQLPNLKGPESSKLGWHLLEQNAAKMDELLAETVTSSKMWPSLTTADQTGTDEIRCQ
jgi:hypothetical protein